MEVPHDEAHYPVICKLARSCADDQGGAKFAFATFALSQFYEGSRLLRLANRHQCRFAADGAYLDRKASVATFSMEDRLIRFHPDRTVPEIMLDLTHETRHLETRMAGIILNASLSPDKALKFHRVNESISSTAEAMIVAESVLMGPKPYMPYDLYEVFRREQSDMEDAFAQALPLAEVGNWPGFAAEMFTAFYRDPSTMAGHANEVDTFLTRAPRRATNPDDSPAHEFLSNRLLVRGRGFLKIDSCNLDDIPGAAEIASSRLVAALNSGPTRQIVERHANGP